MTKKPTNESGMRCPQFRDKCSKVCHTCEWWIPLAVFDKATGLTKETWRCTQVWHAMMMVQVGQDVHQGSAATESLRNAIVSGLARARQPNLIHDNTSNGRALPEITSYNGD